MILPIGIKIAIFLASACVVGWLCFSLAAGFILYCSSFTTDRAGFQSKGMGKAESRSPMYAHTKEPRIMEPIEQGKERWGKRRVEGVFDVLTLRSRDGLLLSGYYWAAGLAEQGSGPNTVVLAHGMMDSAAGLGYLAEEYHAIGWNVLSVDLRSHGDSEGTKRTMGVREGEDIGLWVSLLEERYKAERVFLHGISMGAAAVLLFVGHAREVPPSIRGIIADSVYARHMDVFTRLVEIAVGNRFIARSIARGASLASFFFTGVAFGKMSPARNLARIPVPILFIHGQKDTLVPIGMMREMFSSLLKPGSETVVIPEAPHIGPYFFARSLYMQKIVEFSRRNA